MLIEVLSEDRSSVPVLRSLLEQVLAAHPNGADYRIRVHPHRSLGFLPRNLEARPTSNRTGLYDLLPAKLRAYESLAAYGPMILVVIHDSDGENTDDIYQRLEFLFRRFSPSHFFVIGISVEEMESWILGDWQAIEAAYPQADRKLWEEYSQDSICGTWERLAYILEGHKKADELLRLGYPAVGIYKQEWAQKIAPHLQVERNRSPSLRKFIERFRDVLNLAESKV